jgi:hypothetical protein
MFTRTRKWLQVLQKQHINFAYTPKGYIIERIEGVNKYTGSNTVVFELHRIHSIAEERVELEALKCIGYYKGEEDDNKRVAEILINSLDCEENKNENYYRCY